MKRGVVAFIVLIGTYTDVELACAQADDATLEERFDTFIAPFLKNHCLSCHGAKKQESKLDLSRETSAATVVQNHRVWERVRERLDAGEMPPEDAPRQPNAHDRRAVVDWISAVLEREGRRNAGDPGRVLARRLSNAEYDYTIHDLTGVDLRPTREFPVDPANEAGFDNSGESLTMSPALLKKYLAAARWVADHLVLKPEGFDFAPHTVVTDTDRDKYCVARVVAFYERHRVDYAAYLLAAWRYRNRTALGRTTASLAEFAADARLSPKYLATIWSVLEEPQPEAGPLASLRERWRDLPAGVEKEAASRRACEELARLVSNWRRELVPRVGKIGAPGVSSGSQPLVLRWNREIAAQRMRYSGTGVALGSRRFELKLKKPDGSVTLRFVAAREGDGGDRDYVIWKAPRFRRTTTGKTPRKDSPAEPARISLRSVLEKHAPAEAAKLGFGRHPLGHAIDADSFALKVAADVSVSIPSAALFANRDDAWILIVDGALDGDHFSGGGARILCVQPPAPGQSGADLDDPRVVFRPGNPAIARFEAACTVFCRAFPDAFAVSERGPYFDPEGGFKGRLLTAGFHLMQGFFRDDGPLCELVLDAAGKREIDLLWRELDFVTLAPSPVSRLHLLRAHRAAAIHAARRV